MYLFSAVDADSETSTVFVHQSKLQQRLLYRYGNDMTLIDATYKTNMYDLPLFFLCVCSNSGYVVVATFITRDERQSSIEEALTKLKEFNPSWKPRKVIMDFCEAQIHAMEIVFPGLCFLEFMVMYLKRFFLAQWC